jgi:hypothetical protein
MSDATILCGLRGQKSAVTVSAYKAWEKMPDSGWSRKPSFLRQRLHERFVEPVEKLKPEDKNGFMIMALSCLMIESLESFYQGWGSTEKMSRRAFLYFFARQPRFKAIQDLGLAESFYDNVRCGILHLGETKGGWKIHRTGPLFHHSSLALNATKFHHQVALSLDDYVEQLMHPVPGNRVRQRFNRKMRAVIANCL